MNRLEQVLKLIEQNPDDIFLRYAYALEIKSNGDIMGGIAALKLITTQSPDYLPTYYQLGTWLAEIGNNDEALEYLQSGKKVALTQINNKTASEIQSLIDELAD